MKSAISIIFLALAVALCRADLIVTQNAPQVVGNKTVITLGLKNTYLQPIESARAILFLLDERGKMVGQSSKWVIGGIKDAPSLAAGATNAFSFVITSTDQLVGTNLTAKVSFSRLVLKDGTVENPIKNVSIENVKK